MRRDERAMQDLKNRTLHLQVFVQLHNVRLVHIGNWDYIVRSPNGTDSELLKTSLQRILASNVTKKTYFFIISRFVSLLADPIWSDSVQIRQPWCSSNPFITSGRLLQTKIFASDTKLLARSLSNTFSNLHS